MYSVGDDVGKKITDELLITDRRNISVGKTVKSCSACLNSISDKYLPLMAFLGVGRPILENIDKFPLEGTSLPSSCRGTRLILVLR